MMWFWLAVASGFLSTFGHLLNRVVLKDKGDTLAFSFYYQVIGAVLMIPFLLLGLKLPKAILPYLFLIIIGVVDTLNIFLSMESFKYLEVSLRTIVNQLRIFWILFFSALILGEKLNLMKIIGSCLIFLGIAVAVFQKRKISWWRQLVARILSRKELKSKGILYTLVASFLVSLEMIGVKYLLFQFSYPFIIFASLSASAMVFLFWGSNLPKRTLALLTGPKSRLVWLRGIVGTISLFLALWSVSLTELSRAQPILQSFTILTVLGGVVYLKEKERIWQKLLGGVLTVLGVILVKGS